MESVTILSHFAMALFQVNFEILTCYNKMIFVDEYGSSHANPMVVDDTLINNGNFHGEYPAKGEIKI